jgi:hypothetical protein
LKVKRRDAGALIAIALTFLGALATVSAQDAKQQIKVPQAGVPQIMTIEGEYIRIAYNNEGYVSLGYRTANQSVGEKWLFIEIGATMVPGKPNYTLTRDALSLETPDGATIPLPSNRDYQQVDLRAMEGRATVVHDRIDYFPPMARQACRIGFFSQPGSREMAYDQVELSQNRGCLGRLYFPVPITHGQYWLNVKFPQSVVRVPFRILTEDENKLLKKNYKDIKKQVDDAFKKKS